MRYEFATAARIIAGPGTSAELPGLLAEFGSRAFLVHGAGTITRGGPAADLIRKLEATGLVAALYSAPGEPEIPGVEEGARQARAAGADVVVAVGGGSVLDTAKAIAALATNPGRALDYLEVVGSAKSLLVPALPIVAVPTTAGTGAEVTRNAVVLSPEHRVKASIRHGSMLPRLALVDSTLTHDCPPGVTANSGLDAIAQLIEAFVSRRAQPITDGLCLEGFARAAVALPAAFRNPADAAAREGMSAASLLSGLALANAGLGAVHGIAAALGGSFNIPHGAACAALHPHVVAANRHALLQRDRDNPALERYSRLGELVGGDIYPFLIALCEKLRILPLRAYGVRDSDLTTLAARAARASSTRGNPIDLMPGELMKAIGAAI